MRELTVEVRERKKEGEHWIVSIDPFFDPDDKKRGFRSVITVASQNELDEPTETGWTRKWTKAQVSWPSFCGGERNWEISAFAEGLRIAADAAKRMNEEHKIPEGSC